MPSVFRGANQKAADRSAALSVPVAIGWDGRHQHRADGQHQRAQCHDAQDHARLNGEGHREGNQEQGLSNVDQKPRAGLLQNQEQQGAENICADDRA